MGDESPKNKVKFLCSYGGKVLPRPSDGVLRYVGGETRVVSVGRDITFGGIMKKVNSMAMAMTEGETVLKYQLITEDLDTLVSVRTEEDVKHMIEEHDRHQTGALLRAFLFPPSKPTPTALIASSEPYVYVFEQRYIDAINGIIRTSPRTTATATTKGSACSSPKSNSPEYSPRFSNSNALQRVQSSPSLSGLDHPHHHPFHNHNYYRPPQDPQMGIRLAGTGGGGGRSPAFNYHYRQQQQHKDRGGYAAYYDDSATAAAAAYAHDRIHIMSRSSRIKSIWE